jgi:lipopolysaccharide biosynthesis glycosyltransferase
MLTIDLLTSCDDKLAEYLLPQIASMSESFKKYNVNFHLAHCQVTEEHIALIEEYSKSVGINFIEHKITDNSKFDVIAAGGGVWPAEAYYSLDAHNYLECDRVLYFDAGDVIFDGDIARYYFEDFGGNYLIATIAAYLLDNEKKLPFKPESLTDEKRINRVLRGIINSGSYVMNLSLMRESELTLDNFIKVKDNLALILGKTENLYWGDQGLIGMSFLGDIRFPTEDYIHNVYFMPYNFCLWYFEKLEYLWYEPFVIHFAAGKGKPWKSLFSEEELRRIIDNAENGEPPAIKRFKEDFYDLYFRYAKLTPVYDKIRQTSLSNVNQNSE